MLALPEKMSACAVGLFVLGDLGPQEWSMLLPTKILRRMLDLIIEDEGRNNKAATSGFDRN